jgi:hypothetical protein
MNRRELFLTSVITACQALIKNPNRDVNYRDALLELYLSDCKEHSTPYCERCGEYQILPVHVDLPLEIRVISEDKKSSEITS